MVPRLICYSATYSTYQEFVNRGTTFLSGKSLNQDKGKLKLNSSLQALNDNNELVDLYVKID